jgi:hypothetical protein
MSKQSDVANPLNVTHSHEGPCPNCGYCPTCGRRNAVPFTYPWVNPWPFGVRPPYWQSPVTYGPGTSGGQISGGRTYNYAASI